MKYKILFILLTSILVLASACSAKPENDIALLAVDEVDNVTDITNYDNKYDENAIGSSEPDVIIPDEGIVDDESEDSSQTTEAQQLVNIFGDNVSELNISALLGLEGHERTSFITPLDDTNVIILYNRFVPSLNANVARQSVFYLSLFNTLTWSVVYDEPILGNWFSYSLRTGNNPNERYIITLTGDWSERETHATFIYHDRVETRKLEANLSYIEFLGDYGQPSRTIVHHNLGIYELKDGELIQLIQTIPEEHINWWLDGEWGKIYSIYQTGLYSYNFVAQIDADRFLYTISMSEVIPGFGVYSFKTGEHIFAPNTGDHVVLGIFGNAVYSMIRYWDSIVYEPILFATDVDTLETKPILDAGKFFEDNTDERFPPLLFGVAFSPDGRYIAMIIDSDGFNNYSIYVFNIMENSLKSRHSIIAPSTGTARITFMGDSRLLVFGQSYYRRDEYIFFIDIGR